MTNTDRDNTFHQKTNQVSRRVFLRNSAIIGAAGASVLAPSGIDAAESPAAKPAATKPSSRTTTPKMLLGGKASFSKPLLEPSQLSFRIGLARGRTSAYPMDSMDFIMMDLERPDGRSRHAHWCVGDLSGRTLEFLSCAEGIDGKNDLRLDTLFERILKQQRPSGIIGRYGVGPGGLSPAETPPEADHMRSSCVGRHSCGLLRYYDLTGDARALESAVKLGNAMWQVRDAWRGVLKNAHWPNPYTWTSEFFARLYAATKEDRWLEFCAIIRDSIISEPNMHAHFLMTTLRGLQLTALYTGDLSWSEKPEQVRKLVIERQNEMPDGCTPECFPRSARNEGCSIADWLMLNLNAGLLGNDAAYEKSERIFWNALAFNQFINGSFGHRGLIGNGYGVLDIGEAWWCCVHNAGMAMSEYARHAVTYHGGAIHVNFMVPGRFELSLPGGSKADLTIATSYPSKAEATVVADNVPDGVPVKFRVPTCVRKPDVKQSRTGSTVNVTFTGELGHRIEQCNPGVVLTYGPLVLIPGTGLPAATAKNDPSGAPPGYIPQALPTGTPTIKLSSPADAEGYVKLPLCPSERPLPVWSYFDEGPGAPTWVEGSAVEVQLKFPGGAEHAVRFTPMCYNTSNLSFFDTPIVFQDAKKS
ncbi:MAG: glycoside hydrolase family 127 protein [Pirellulales bacterium]|nr:glycoside hydrolase family 127 protein [Pirellulales bacterium]